MKLKFLSLFALLLLSACGGSDATTPQQDAVAADPLLSYGNSPPCSRNPNGAVSPTDPIFCVEITGSTTVEVAQTSNLQCTAYNINGRVLSTTFEWSSSSNTYATLSSSGAYGSITGVKGTPSSSSEWVYCLARNSATPGGVHGTRTLTVLAPVRSVAVTPTQVSVAATTTTPLTAVAKDAGGNVLSGKAFTWSSSNSSVASVNALGVVTGVSTGTATVTASAEGVTSSPVQVTVTPAPQIAVLTLSDRNMVDADSTRIVTVYARDPNGVQFRPPPVTLTFSPASAVVDGEQSTSLPQREYRVRGLLADHVIITASVNGVQDTSWLSVAPGISIQGPASTPTAGSYTWTSTVSGCNGGCTYQWVKTPTAFLGAFSSPTKAPTLSTGTSVTMSVSESTGFYVGLKVVSNGKATHTFYRVN